VSTSKQRRESAQRHLQRQLERRAEQAKVRRRNMSIVAAVVAVLVITGVVLLGTGVLGGDGDGGGDAGSSASPSEALPTAPEEPAPGDDGTDGTCDFTPDESGNPNLTDVGVPPAEVETTGTTQATMTMDAGEIGLTLDRANAPCATASLVYLAQEGFFDGTPCHRLTASEGLKVLQCGDPSGTGSGGPSYQFPTRVTGQETYSRGTLAMANSGQGFDGSQFFLVYGDSQLTPDYTVLGTIDEAGLGVLDEIAAAGIEGEAEDGAPAEPVTITSLEIAS
jgi:peptidyl-prolyl cis-trans isomerase B (cyclophilin B)